MLDQVQIPWEGAIFGKRGAHCEVYGLRAVSCAKMAEPIDLPFGLWTRVGPRSTSSVVFARWRQCALMGEYIGAIWCIRLNRPSAAAMQPYAKLL